MVGSVLCRLWLVGVCFGLLACSSESAEPDEATGGAAGSGMGGTGPTGGSGGSGDPTGGTAGSETGGGGSMAGSGAEAGGGGAGTGSGGGAGSGGMGGGSAGASGAGGTGGTDDMRLFVPDIPNVYEGTVVDPGVEVIAHTLREDGLLGPEWLVAVENKGTDYLCSLDIESRFLDSAGTELASGTSLVETPFARGSSGTGSLVKCLGPGQIGMAINTTALSNISDPGTIAEVRHSFGALILTDAAPTTDITVMGVAVMMGTAGRNQFTGQVQNGSDAAVTNPSISIFGTNAVGRPLFEVTDAESTTIAPGASWSFTTGNFDEPFSEYVAFPDVTD